MSIRVPQSQIESRKRIARASLDVINALDGLTFMEMYQVLAELWLGLLKDQRRAESDETR